MKRIYKSILLVVVLFSVIVAPIFAATYTCAITVTNTGATSYTQYPFILPIDNGYLANQSYITSTGLDVKVNNNGADIPTALATDRTNFSTELASGQSIQPSMTFGNTALTSMPIIMGGSGYASYADNAALEDADNFSHSWIDTYVDTSSGSNKFLLNKSNAITVDAGTSTSGKVTANIYSTLSQDTGSYVQAVYGGAGAYQRSGQKFTIWSAGIIGGISIPVSKTGSPTGTASVTVRSVSDDTLLGTLGTFDVSTVSGASVTVSNPVIVPTAQSIYILVEYSGGNVSNCINLTLVTPSAYANGNAVVYNGAYTDYAGHDLRWTDLSYPVVTTNTTVASGEHDVQVQADGAVLELDIDNPTLVTNGDYGIGDPPTSWTLGGAGATVSQSTAQVKLGTYSAAVTRNGTNAQLYQNKSVAVGVNTYTLGCWVWSSVANSARLRIRFLDGAQEIGALTTEYSLYHTGDSQWQWLSVTTSPVTAIDTVRAVMYVFVDSTAYFDGAKLVLGSTITPTTSGMINTVDISGASIPDNSNAWLLNQNNVNSYISSYTHTVSGTELIKYEPNDLILSGTLYNTGTATFTSGNTDVVGIGTAWTSGMVGGKIRSDVDGVYYDISAVGSATSITLSTAYHHTGGIGQAYRIGYPTSYTTGTVTLTPTSTSVVGAGGATFTATMVGGKIKGDTDGVYYNISGFTDATHITLSTAYSETGGSGLNYTLLYNPTGYLPNLDSSGSYPATITWGANTTGIAISAGSLISSNNPSVTADATSTQVDMAKQNINMGNPTGNDNAQIQKNIFTPWFQPFSQVTNIPLIGFLLFWTTAALIFCVVKVMKYTGSNQFIGGIVLIVGEALLYKIGLFELWAVISSAFIVLAILIFERKPSM